MLTYHEIDVMMVEADQYIDDLFRKLEEMMLGKRVNIPMEAVNGSQENDNLPDTTRR